MAVADCFAAPAPRTFAGEHDFYQGIYTQSQAQFGSYVDAGTLLNNYAHVLDLLTRLRQAINHPYLVIYSKREMEDKAQGGGTAGSGSAGGICGLCFEDAMDPVLTGCGHPFCRQCMRDYIETLATDAVSQCPTCHGALSVDLHAASCNAFSSAYTDGSSSVGAESSAAGGGGGGGGGVAAAGMARRGLLSRVDLSRFQSSTKIEALMEELHLMKEVPQPWINLCPPRSPLRSPLSITAFDHLRSPMA